MTDDDKNFLARWSQRKLEANKPAPAHAELAHDAEPVTPVNDETKPVDKRADEESEAFDLASLPKLEDLTATSDIKVFFRQGVPESLRNAALRKAWALDPAIRNYVNPALDYAYDWNTPGGVPGNSELAAGTDIANLVSRIIGTPEPPPPPSVGNSESQDLGDPPPINDGGMQTNPVTDTPAPASVRLSVVDLPPRQEDASRDGNALAADSNPEHGHSAAPQQDVRRHGAAKPRL